MLKYSDNTVLEYTQGIVILFYWREKVWQTKSSPVQLNFSKSGTVGAIMDINYTFVHILFSYWANKAAPEPVFVHVSTRFFRVSHLMQRNNFFVIADQFRGMGKKISVPLECLSHFSF
jgi:hypothetical protein